MTHQHLFTCDGCGLKDTTGKSRNDRHPDGWVVVSIHVAGDEERCRHACGPACAGKVAEALTLEIIKDMAEHQKGPPATPAPYPGTPRTQI